VKVDTEGPDPVAETARVRVARDYMSHRRGFHFFLVPTNTTLRLQDSMPKRSQRAFSVSSYGNMTFADVHWSAWKQLVIQGLAMHRARTLNPAAADVCIVASPPDGKCEQWASLCSKSSQPLVVIDATDADFVGQQGLRCETLWRSMCKRSTTQFVLRVVGSPPVHGKRSVLLRRCRFVTIPWVSHATSALAAQQPGVERPIRIAFAAGITGHSMARVLGYEAWRRELHAACVRLHARDASHCKFVPQSLAGGGSHRAVALYARSTFCLMPPGDTLARQGIADAITFGCVPVFFHAGQLALWPWHWNATRGAVFEDWGAYLSMRPRNATAALERLLHLPAAHVRKLRQEIARVAPSFVYRPAHRARSQEQDAPDAVDAFLLSLEATLRKHTSAPRILQDA
jgi:hypothetical protein